MNPTDEVDDLLTRAGAQWRADQPSAPEPDLDRMLGGRKRPRALGAGAGRRQCRRDRRRRADRTAGRRPEPRRSAPSYQATSRDVCSKSNRSDRTTTCWSATGDRVEVGGEVIAAPGKPPVFCPPRTRTLAIGYPPGKEPAPTCPADISPSR